MSAQGQRGRETQAAAEALGSVLVSLVLRDVPLKLRLVLRDEAALGAAELSFETLGRGSPRGRVPLLLLRVYSSFFRCMSLKLEQKK